MVEKRAVEVDVAGGHPADRVAGAFAVLPGADGLGRALERGGASRRFADGGEDGVRRRVGGEETAAAGAFGAEALAGGAEIEREDGEPGGPALGQGVAPGFRPWRENGGEGRPDLPDARGEVVACVGAVEDQAGAGKVGNAHVRRAQDVEDDGPSAVDLRHRRDDVGALVWRKGAGDEDPEGFSGRRGGGERFEGGEVPPVGDHAEVGVPCLQDGQKRLEARLRVRRGRDERVAERGDPILEPAPPGGGEAGVQNRAVGQQGNPVQELRLAVLDAVRVEAPARIQELQGGACGVVVVEGENDRDVERAQAGEEPGAAAKEVAHMDDFDAEVESPVDERVVVFGEGMGAQRDEVGKRVFADRCGPGPRCVEQFHPPPVADQHERLERAVQGPGQIAGGVERAAVQDPSQDEQEAGPRPQTARDGGGDEAEEGPGRLPAAEPGGLEEVQLRIARPEDCAGLADALGFFRRSEGGGVEVPDERARNDAVRPSAAAGAEAQVVLLPVSLAERLFVEAPDVVEHGALEIQAEAVAGVPVEHGVRPVHPPAGDLRHGEMRRHSVETGLGNGNGAGVVRDGRGAADPVVAVGGEPERVGPAGGDDRVVVEKDDVPAPGGADAVVACAGESGVLVEAFDPDAFRVGGGEPPEHRADARVAAAVLDEKQEDVRRRVLEERRDERRQELRVVVDRDDDGERSHGRGLGAGAADGRGADLRAEPHRAQNVHQLQRTGGGGADARSEAPGVRDQRIGGGGIVVVVAARIGGGGDGGVEEPVRDAPPRPPSVEAIVEQGRGEMDGRHLRMRPAIVVAVEQARPAGGEDVLEEADAGQPILPERVEKPAKHADGGTEPLENPVPPGESRPKGGQSGRFPGLDQGRAGRPAVAGRGRIRGWGLRAFHRSGDSRAKQVVSQPKYCNCARRAVLIESPAEGHEWNRPGDIPGGRGSRACESSGGTTGRSRVSRAPVPDRAAAEGCRHRGSEAVAKLAPDGAAAAGGGGGGRPAPVRFSRSGSVSPPSAASGLLAVRRAGGAGAPARRRAESRRFVLRGRSSLGSVRRAARRAARLAAGPDVPRVGALRRGFVGAGGRRPPRTDPSRGRRRGRPHPVLPRRRRRRGPALRRGRPFRGAAGAGPRTGRPSCARRPVPLRGGVRVRGRSRVRLCERPARAGRVPVRSVERAGRRLRAAGHDFVGRGFACRRARLEAAGGFRAEAGSAATTDLLFRLCETAGGGPAHIAAPLLADAAPLVPVVQDGASAEARVADARRALEAHLARTGFKARVETPSPGRAFFRVRPPRPDPAPLVSIVIPNRENPNVLETCVRSILSRTLYPNYEVVIVESGSSKPETFALYDRLSEDPRVRVVRFPKRPDEPFNYSKKCNFGAAQCRGEFLLMLNSDTEAVLPDWMDEMLGFAARPDVGVVGALLLFGNATVQHAGLRHRPGGLPDHIERSAAALSPGRMGRLLHVQEYEAVTFACAMVRTSVWAELGGLDESFAVAFNDVDFCYRARARGLKVVWTPFATLFHHESLVRGSDFAGPNRARFLGEIAHLRERWGGLLARPDPFFDDLAFTSLPGIR